MCAIHDLLLILGSLGLLFILRDGTIFDVPRNILKSKSAYLKELLECPMCLGFWVGFCSKMFFLFLVHENNFTFSNVLLSVYFGFIISLFGMITHNILDILDIKAFLAKKKAGETSSRID